MSEYHRFMAYIYEYEDGKRRRNIGHAKVTLRNGMVGIQLRILTGKEEKMKLYCFTREKERMRGFLLREGESRKGSWDLEINIAEEQLLWMGCPFSEWRGLWIICKDTSKAFISVWDDEQIDMERFVIDENESEKSYGKGIIKEDWIKELTEEGENAERERYMGYKDIEEKVQDSGKSNKEEKGLVANGIDSLEPTRLGKRWHQFQCQYPHIQPFSDEEITQCIQIAPKDISFLGSKEFCYCNNSFVQHKFLKYRHLLLGLHENGQFVLGVPGLCRGKQDQHLATMYGFPEFKKVSDSSAMEGGEFGYWYHELTE